MSAQAKISVRKILQMFLTLVVSTACITAIVSASKMEDRKTLKSVAVHFKNDKRYHFIEDQEILDLAIKKTHTDIEHTPVSRLDVRGMERLIMADPWVAFSQVYVDNERVLHLYVTQRIPVARVFQQNGASFYLDTTLSIMPLSSSYSYCTTVVTNVPELKNDSAGWALRKDIVSLARAIQADTFWNAQVSEVIVDSPGMYEFVPIIGDQRIIFGDARGIREKFHSLFVFYDKVLNKIGWDKYQSLDVRFNGQVVAAPSLPYNGPVDKGVNTMNWITTMVETEGGIDAKDSAHAPDTKPVAAAAKPGPPAGQAAKVAAPAKTVPAPAAAVQKVVKAVAPVKAPVKKAGIPVAPGKAVANGKAPVKAAAPAKAAGKAVAPLKAPGKPVAAGKALPPGKVGGRPAPAKVGGKPTPPATVAGKTVPPGKTAGKGLTPGKVAAKPAVAGKAAAKPAMPGKTAGKTTAGKTTGKPVTPAKAAGKPDAASKKVAGKAAAAVKKGGKPAPAPKKVVKPVAPAAKVTKPVAAVAGKQRKAPAPKTPPADKKQAMPKYIYPERKEY